MVAVVPRVPRLPTYVVERTQLLARLDEPVPLTILRAPTGFGKTALLARWATNRASTESTVWVGLDDDDRESVVFWATVLDALRDSGVATDRGSAGETPGRRRVRRAVDAWPTPLTLVIDGYDHAPDEADRDLVDLIRRIPRLRLVVGLRGHLRLPPGARMGLGTTVIDAVQLLFTADEVAELLTAQGSSASPASVTAVYEQTNGWPALVTALADGVTEDSLSVDYVRSHLLPQVDEPRLRRFLMIASIPQPLTADVMQMLTDDVEASDNLTQLESAGALFATTEDGKQTYQLPSAMRTVLKAELTTAWPDVARDVHTRLARWYLMAQVPPDALKHAIAARNWPLIVEVIQKFWGVLLGIHRELLEAAFQIIPLSEITSTRVLACRDLMMQAPDDTLLALTPPLPAARSALEALGRSAGVNEALETGLLMMMAQRRRGMYREALDYSNRLEIIARVARVARTEESRWHLPPTYMQTGATRLLAGDITGAIAHLQICFHMTSEGHAAHVAADATGRAALSWALLGETRRATTWLERHEAASDPPQWAAALARSAGYAARALVAADRLMRADARDALDRVQAGKDADESWPFVAYARALYALVWGDAIGALSDLDTARTAHKSWIGDGGFARPLLAATEADLLISLGWGNQARAIIDGPDRHRTIMQLPRARLALLTGHPQEALQTANSTAWIRSAPSRLQREMLLLHALAHLRLDDVDTAAILLRRAVRRARSAQAIRAFATVPADEFTVLAERVPESVQLLDHPLVRDAAPIYPRSLTLVTLTERETLVLKGVARKQTMPQIAETLFVSYNTVKSQMRSLYQKLGARSRTEAVARAQALGILD